MDTANNKNQIMFPENARRIVTELTRKYKIKESTEELAAKIEKEEETQGRKIARLLTEIQEGELTQKDLPFELEKRLGIPKTKAKNLAKEIQEKIFLSAPLKKEEPLPEISAPPEEKETAPDVYREPLE